MNRIIAVSVGMVFALFTKESFAQEVRVPTAEECASLFPCEPAKVKRTKVRRARPEKLSQPDPEILRRLQDLERRAWEPPSIQIVREPAEIVPSGEAPLLSPAPVVNNYVTVQAPTPTDQETPEHDVRFGLEIGGLASIHSSWWETSPGFYGAARLKLKRLALSVESGYQRTVFQDGSTAEDVYVGPTAGYEFGNRKLRFTITAGLGYWTTLEDWIAPICGRSTCDGENENALTASLEPGLTMNVVKNLEFSLGMPVRWVSSTPDGDEWTLGIRAGVGVFLP